MSFLRKVESTLALLDGNIQPFAKDIYAAVIWHFEIVDARHDAGKIVVRCVRRLAGFANHGEHGRESLEA